MLLQNIFNFPDFYILFCKGCQNIQPAPSMTSLVYNDPSKIVYNDPSEMVYDDPDLERIIINHFRRIIINLGRH